MVERKRRRFDAPFKREAIRIAETSGKGVREVEKDLGLHQGAIRHWQEELGSDPERAFPGTGHQKPLEEALRRLSRENAVPREKRDILEKAAAIFSRTS